MINWKMYYKKVRMNGIEKSVPFVDLYRHDNLMYSVRCLGEYEANHIKHLLEDVMFRSKQQADNRYEELIRIVHRSTGVRRLSGYLLKTNILMVS
jgi:hypothetical protein